MVIDVRLNNIEVIYPNGTCGVKNIDAFFEGGKVCGLVGVNGAGKSTLFKTIMGFLKPTHGEVNICGLSVRDALRQNLVAYVPQTENVDWNFPVLVEDVVMMGRYGQMGFLRRPKKEDHQAVEEALKRVGMDAFRRMQIGELSGGQKKRVFVARALAQGGQVILLDEPFTGIDIKTEDSLIQLFRSLAQEGRLILVSTHNLGSVPYLCDNVMLINQKMLAYGSVESTFTKDNLAKAFGTMLRDHKLLGSDLHDDEDARSVTVLTDDERPLVLYGAEGDERITRAKSPKKKVPKGSV